MKIPSHIISQELQASSDMQQLLAHKRFKIVRSTKEDVEWLEQKWPDYLSDATIVPGSRRIALEIGVGAHSQDASKIKRMLDECNRLLKEDLTT